LVLEHSRSGDPYRGNHLQASRRADSAQSRQFPSAANNIVTAKAPFKLDTANAVFNPGEAMPKTCRHHSLLRTICLHKAALVLGLSYCHAYEIAASQGGGRARSRLVGRLISPHGNPFPCEDQEHCYMVMQQTWLEWTGDVGGIHNLSV